MENPIKMDDLGVPLFSETSCWLVGDFTDSLCLLPGPLGEMIQFNLIQFARNMFQQG